MKKLILLALTFSSLSAFAQTSIGVRAGLNLAKIVSKDGDITETTDNLAGVNIAIPFEFKLSETFAIQPELGFSQRGSKESIEFLGEKFETKVVLNYFEVPILAKVAFGNEKIKFNILAGPSLGFALNGKIKADNESIDIDFKEYGIKRSDFALQFGAGVTLMAGPGRFFIDGRYALGVSNLATDAPTDDQSAKNRGMGFNIGYLYTLGGK